MTERCRSSAARLWCKRCRFKTFYLLFWGHLITAFIHITASFWIRRLRLLFVRPDRPVPKLSKERDLSCFHERCPQPTFHLFQKSPSDWTRPAARKVSKILYNTTLFSDAMSQTTFRLIGVFSCLPGGYFVLVSCSRSPSLQTLSRNPVTVNTLTLSLWCRSVGSQVKLGIFSINISYFFVRLWEFLRQRINCTLRRFNKCTSAADEEWFQTTVLNVLHCIAAPERLHQFRFWVKYKPVAAWKEGKMLFSV